MKQFLHLLSCIVGLSLSLSLHAQVQTSFSRYVNNGTDDAEQRIGTGAMDLTSSDLEITRDGSSASGDQVIGIRFANINIPKGVTIDSAFIQFASNGDKAPVNANAFFKAELSPNSATFTTTAFNISTRTATADSILWPGSTDPSWGVGTQNTRSMAQRSPNIASLVNQVMNQSAWATGNPVTIFISGLVGVRNARSFNGSATFAPELIIHYTQNTYQPITFPVLAGSVWKYRDNGVFPGSTWKDVTFNDSAWTFKNGKFGYGDSCRTILSFGPDSNNRHITSYFRTQFNMTNTAGFDTLIFRLLRDDGAVVYINGIEAFRSNMPTGTITHTTLASTDITGAAEQQYIEFRVGNTLINGLNTIAVEVHQASASSNDKGFDMQIAAKRVPMSIVNYPSPRNAEWYYLDDGTDQGTAWRAPSFYEGNWNYGPGILGYGDPSATTLGFGPNSSNKYITYYFRKKINVPSVAALTDSVIFSIMRDDGAVVFVNGVEVFKTNMPDTGVINFMTWSSTIVDGAAERQYNNFYVPKSVFVNGVNTIAVEVHQRDGFSSDLTFEMEIMNDTRQLNFTSPTAAQTIQAGQNFNINWFNIPSINRVNIQVSTNNRASWTNLATNILATAKPFVWAVPNINNSTTWLRITDSTGTFRDSVNIWIYPTPAAFNPCADPNHVGCFTSLNQTRNQVFRVPSTHTFQEIGRQGQIHNLGGTVGGNLDFTGFMARNGSSRSGALGVNEENTPGGVSVFYIRYNDSTGTWLRDSSGKVNLSAPGLVQSTRNCSGGITPWGTIITSEESLNTGDVNADGYIDVGWQVEYNPWTREVRDYNNDGIRDKLWAMGRLSHENIVVAPDSLTAYQAEDGGSSGLYKFVAFQKGRLDSGLLYVMQRTGTTGNWILVPNTTQTERNNVSSVVSGLGATNFNGPEDVEINPVNGMIYFTSKNNSMIYRCTDNGMTVSNFEDYVGNAAVTYTHNVEGGGTQTVTWGSGIDNLSFDNLGNLWAQQDGGQSNIWVIRPDHTPFNPKADLFATTPSGSESSGLTFTPNFRYGFLSIMGASSTNTASAIDAAGNSVVFNVSNTVVIGRRQFLGPLAAVPVEFDGFYLTRGNENSVKVNWSTASEQNNSHFVIQRSTDNENFTDVAEVEGSGNSSTRNLYAFNDNNLKPNLYYYRIKQVDYNGAFAYSVVRSINLKEKANVIADQVYPNPFNTEINLSVFAVKAENASVIVGDLNGKVVIEKSFNLSEGEQTLTIPTENLPSGVYIIQVKAGQSSYSYKLVK